MTVKLKRHAVVTHYFRACAMEYKNTIICIACKFHWLVSESLVLDFRFVNGFSKSYIVVAGRAVDFGCEWESVETKKVVIFPVTSTPANCTIRELRSGLVKYSRDCCSRSADHSLSGSACRKKWAIEKKTGKRQQDSTWWCVLACLHVAVLRAPADIMSITLYLTLFLLTLCLSLILSDAWCTFHSWEITVYPGLNLRLPPLYLRHFLFVSLNYHSVSHETLSPVLFIYHSLSVFLSVRHSMLGLFQYSL